MSYSKRQCHICKRMISYNGLAWVGHMRKHVREGIVLEFEHDYEWSKIVGRRSYFVRKKDGKRIG